MDSPQLVRYVLAMGPMKRVGRLVLIVVLVAAASGCRDQQRRYGDYQDTGASPSANQCKLPVAQRQGGWVCADG